MNARCWALVALVSLVAAPHAMAETVLLHAMRDEVTDKLFDPRPLYFGEIMANLLFWLGPDKLCFGSDYAIWSPKWLIEKFMAFELPDDLN